jgi:hypothetical protein
MPHAAQHAVRPASSSCSAVGVCASGRLKSRPSARPAVARPGGCLGNLAALEPGQVVLLAAATGESSRARTSPRLMHRSSSLRTTGIEWPGSGARRLRTWGEPGTGARHSVDVALYRIDPVERHIHWFPERPGDGICGRYARYARYGQRERVPGWRIPDGRTGSPGDG